MRPRAAPPETAAAEALLAMAAARWASDLAFEPQDDGALKAGARIDGVRVVLGAIAAEHARAALSRLKVLARLPGYITEEPQDGRIDGTPFGAAGDLRIAFLPTVRGERAAIRLPVLGPLPAPSQLGLELCVISALRTAVRAGRRRSR